LQGLLVRVGIDQTFGGWNAPVNKNNQFVFVPIPDTSYNEDGSYIPDGEQLYREKVTAPLQQFGLECDRPDHTCFRLPPRLDDKPMHLDPDFKRLTYGDDDGRRGRMLKEFDADDFLAFYSSFRPVEGGKLVYALIGLFVLTGRPVRASQILDRDRLCNAHTRWKSVKCGDIVAFGKDGESGLFDQCIPIGEWRENAYRVRENILDKWGGISIVKKGGTSPVKNGWIQRSVHLPLFDDPGRFKKWLDHQRAKHNIRLVRAECRAAIAQGTQAG
jgi:hypothetical protein